MVDVNTVGLTERAMVGELIERTMLTHLYMITLKRSSVI